MSNSLALIDQALATLNQEFATIQQTERAYLQRHCQTMTALEMDDNLGLLGNRSLKRYLYRETYTQLKIALTTPIAPAANCQATWAQRILKAQGRIITDLVTQMYQGQTAGLTPEEIQANWHQIAGLYE